MRKRWLTTREVADRFGVSLVTVYRWCRDGDLRARRRVTRWQVDAESVERLAARRKPTWDEAKERVTREHESLWRKLSEM